MNRTRNLAVLSLLVGLVTFAPYCRAEGLKKDWSVDVLSLQGRANRQNVLKLFSAAVDTTRDRVYIAGIKTSHIGILDAATDRVLGTLYSGLDEGGIQYLQVDSASGDLYVLDATNRQLRRIEAGAGGHITGPASMPESAGNFVVDSGRRRLYLTTRQSPGFRAYDAVTLQAVWTQNAMGEGTGPLVFDAAGDVIYVLDIQATSTVRKIHRIDAGTGGMLEPLTYRSSGGERSRFLARDGASGRLFVGTGRGVKILDSQGREQGSFSFSAAREVSRFRYLSGPDLVVAVSIDAPSGGRVAGIGGHLEVYEPASGRKIKDLDLGRKPHRMAIDGETGRIWVPEADASVVWKIEAPAFASPTRIRLGDSMEGVVRGADGRIYGNSRLGGSYLLSFDPQSRAHSNFSAGTWPIPIRADETGEHLLVLNAWDSTISVFRVLPSLTLVATIPVGLPAGSTDRLPDMIVDSTHGLAFVGYPEHAKVAVVDWVARRSEAILAVPGARPGDTGGGPFEGCFTPVEGCNKSALCLGGPADAGLKLLDPPPTLFELVSERGDTRNETSLFGASPLHIGP